MSLLSWSELDSTWLNITNLALGIVVVICAAIMVGGIAHELIARVRKRRRIEAEIDRDMQMLNDGRAFHSPHLGITMADGGEQRKP